MKFADTLRGLLRRWYIVVPGIIVTVTIALGAWFAIPPGYERSATQLLIPSANSLPEGANPYLYLGGLSPAADVLVRATGSKNVLNDVIKQHPGVEISISRDTTTAGPIILITVTAGSDAAAEDVLGLLVARTSVELNELQQVEGIPVGDRITVIPITVDNQSILQQRVRTLGVAGTGIVGVMLTLFVASIAEGSNSQRKHRRGLPDGESADTGGNDVASNLLDSANRTNLTRASQDARSTPDPSLDRLSDDEQALATSPPPRSTVTSHGR